MFELVTTHPPFSIPVAEEQASFFGTANDAPPSQFHMLVRDQQGRVSLERVLEHNFFKFADILPKLLG